MNLYFDRNWNGETKELLYVIVKWNPRQNWAWQNFAAARGVKDFDPVEDSRACWLNHVAWPFFSCNKKGKIVK